MMLHAVLKNVYSHGKPCYGVPGYVRKLCNVLYNKKKICKPEIKEQHLKVSMVFTGIMMKIPTPMTLYQILLRVSVIRSRQRKGKLQALPLQLH